MGRRDLNGAFRKAHGAQRALSPLWSRRPRISLDPDSHHQPPNPQTKVTDNGIDGEEIPTMRGEI